MFMLNGQPLSPDSPFTTPDGTQYPANWLRLASAGEKAAIGIEEVNDPEPYDDRFYWGPGNPKDLEMVRSMLAAQIKATSYSLLAPTDYKLVRKVETGEEVDEPTLTQRSAIRATYTANQALIQAATSVEQLAALQLTWPTEQQAAQS
jgi:hypothetical protein